MTDTSRGDLRDLYACRAKLAKYISDRKIFRTNFIVEENEIHMLPEIASPSSLAVCCTIK
jgi:hypothetical protein